MPRHKLPNPTFKNPDIISFSYFTLKSRSPTERRYQTTTSAFHGEIQWNKGKGLQSRIILGKGKQKSKKLSPLSVLRHVRFLSIFPCLSIGISLSPYDACLYHISITILSHTSSPNFSFTYFQFHVICTNFLHAIPWVMYSNQQEHPLWKYPTVKYIFLLKQKDSAETVVVHDIFVISRFGLTVCS